MAVFRHGLNAPRHVNLPEDEGGAMIAGEKLRLLLFQSCPLTRAGLSHVLASTDDIELVSVAACLPEAMARATQTAHDLILMDLDLSCEDNCDPVRRLHHASRGAKILIFSARAGNGEVLRALDAGAAGYILKSAGRDEILSAVQHVVARERYLAPVIAQHLAEYIGKERLTQRELEVLAFVREGFRNRQIAHQLRVAETTVSFHIKNTLAKLHANDRTHAVTIAIKRGLLSTLCGQTSSGPRYSNDELTSKHRP